MKIRLLLAAPFIRSLTRRVFQAEFIGQFLIHAVGVVAQGFGGQCNWQLLFSRGGPIAVRFSISYHLKLPWSGVLSHRCLSGFDACFFVHLTLPFGPVSFQCLVDIPLRTFFLHLVLGGFSRSFASAMLHFFWRDSFPRFLGCSLVFGPR